MYYYPVSAVLTECLILSVVEQQDSYGYEISQTVKLVDQGIDAVSYFEKAGDGRISDYLFRGIPGAETKVLFHHGRGTQAAGISEERMAGISQYCR